MTLAHHRLRIWVGILVDHEGYQVSPRKRVDCAPYAVVGTNELAQLVVA